MDIIMDVEWRAAEDLITADRYDLMAKLTYVECQMKHYDMTWAKELYAAHIEAFSGGSYQEPGQPWKNSLQAYLNSFDALIQSISSSGYHGEESNIPVSADRKCILDGAHRVAVCAYLKKDVACYTVPQNQIYNYFFFKKQFLGEKYLDYMALQYIKIKKEKLSVVCIWPALYKDKSRVSEWEYLIKEKAKIVYEKTLPVTRCGIRNFYYIVKNKYLNDVSEYLFGKNGKVKIYLVELEKEGGRLIEPEHHKSIIDKGLFISKTQGECINASNCLFHRQTYHFLCYEDIRQMDPLFIKLGEFDQLLNAQKLDVNDFLMVPTVDGAAGDSEAEYKLKYITVEKNALSLSAADCLNEDVLPWKEKASVSDLVLNPQHYIFFRNFKMISWSARSVLDGWDQGHFWLKGRTKNFWGDRIQLSFYLNDMKTDVARISRNMRTKVRDGLQKHHIYFFTKLWHYIHGKGFRG